MKSLKMVAIWLLIIGGLNWGLTALGYNVVDMIFGSMGLANVVYLLVGLAAVYKLYLMFSKGGSMSSSGSGGTM